MKTFDVIRDEQAIKVQIADDGFATLTVYNINDADIVVQAISQANREGAIRGVMFTGEVLNDQMAQMHKMRTMTGTTWLGGTITRLQDGALGPSFRIDWEMFPIISA